MLSALSPLDGRYAEKLTDLAALFSEQALMKARVEVEVAYFIALSNEAAITELPPMKGVKLVALNKLVSGFDATAAKRIKTIEKRTNHDVKAVEYYLKEKLEKVAGLKKYTEFVHFGLTSEDVNNLAYGLLIERALKAVIRPQLKSLTSDLLKLAKKWHDVTLLSHTHGQPATPTTVGDQLMVYVDRLEAQQVALKGFTMHGKFGGAVGNYAAHRAAYPAVRWNTFGRKLVRTLGLTPLSFTHQSNPHDDVAELCHILMRIDAILLDLARDSWLYISRGVFKQKVVKGEVGSSTMPHKVNPIDFENAEGNLGLADSLFGHFAIKLPVSRLQRDLSDSTVQRSIGSAFGYHSLAVQALAKGLSKLQIDRKQIKKELMESPQVLAEAIQTILRRKKVKGAYEKLKKVTRGERVTLIDLLKFMEEEGFSTDEIERVLMMLQ